ncbi:MAG TPA: zinc ABC transporter substrate-binding protein [Hyphomicrobiaceae bacterium]|nr:zinc ABC transporter substrate-binding protein [Hyphomicrobiaceae bacterium]
MMRHLGLLAAFGLVLVGGAARADELNVVATIKPIHSIAASVMAGVGEPRLLIDGTASPHTFTLKPSDAKALSAARVVFRVSDGLEPFMIKVARSLPKSAEVVTLEKVPGLTLLEIRSGGTFDDDDHTHGKSGKHSHSHDHDKNAIDGHLYLDPANAILIATHMAEVLSKADPASAERLKANAEAFGRDMRALMAELEARTKPLADRPFIVFHDAYQYFERRFGLEAAGSVTVSPDIAPSARRLSALRRKISALKAVCVFSEPQFEPRLVATITEKTNARRGVLDPLGVAIPAGVAHYPTLLRNLAADLEACLKA